jgi:UPF0755 protein
MITFKSFFIFFKKIYLKLGIFIFILFLSFLIYVFWNLKPVDVKGAGVEKMFKINNGESFLEITNNLYKEKLIRSKISFAFLGFLTGQFLKMHSGLYKLNSNLNSINILFLLSSGKGKEVRVLIPEGETIYEIDAILAENNVLKKGELIDYIKKNNLKLEGYLMPDTYIFFYDSKPEDVIKKMTDNFNLKIKPLIEEKKANETSTLILASMLEKEAPDFEDRKIIAGILLKRLKLNIPLQVDATICYIKIIQNNGSINCLPLLPLDFKINSEYNTYVNKGLPPGPISNPSKEAVLAALNPIESEYLYYLSDPITKKTIFSKTLEEHNKNILKFLKK